MSQGPIALLLAAALGQAGGGAEQRIVDYLRAEVKPGEPVVVTRLYNEVFTSADERAVLDRLFDTFFKIPLFAAQFQQASGRPPSLAELSEQFHFTVAGEADVMLRIMQSDPRLPPFLDRDPATGEITRVDTDAILQHPLFGKRLERSLSGMVGRMAPTLDLETYDGETLDSGALAGTPHLVYFWFTGCPPCVKTTPLLVELYAEYAPKGFEIVAVNADRALGLPYSDEQRLAYAQEQGIRYRLAHATQETLDQWGAVSVYPTFFFVDAGGVIVAHDVTFQERSKLVAATLEALE